MLNEEQAAAIDKINQWLVTPDQPFFLLSGSAGTGKTYCVKELNGKFVFTAPTNKATKVLRDSVSTLWNRPMCRTIYSLLGLRLDSSGEIRVITKAEPGSEKVDLKKYTAVIVDEGSMVNKTLLDTIREVATRLNVKFLFMGDPMQLPPINETGSLIWSINVGAHLTKVMRYDNAILELATQLRDQIENDTRSISLKSKNTGTTITANEGVWKKNKDEFEATLKEQAEAGLFSLPNMSKVIAWRNVRVDMFNTLIRNSIFKDKNVPRWAIGDRVIFTAPAIDRGGNIIATTDDEGIVTSSETECLNILDIDFKVWSLAIKSDFDDKSIPAIVLHEDSAGAYHQILREIAEAAKAKKRPWNDYWTFKEIFNELRYAYAITAHRSQGSTYDTAFVCWQDILRNTNELEAYKCLYVASTRPKRALVFS